MREVQIVRWCDHHAKRGEHVASTVERMISIVVTTVPMPGLVRPAPRRLDLCESCDVELTDKLRELLAARGRKSDAAPALASSSSPPAVLVAPVVVEPSRKLTKRERERAPWQCPLCELTLTKHAAADHVWVKHVRVKYAPPKGNVCPECGSKHDSVQQVAGHRNRAHGWTRLAEGLDRLGVAS